MDRDEFAVAICDFLLGWVTQQLGMSTYHLDHVLSLSKIGNVGLDGLVLEGCEELEDLSWDW